VRRAFGFDDPGNAFRSTDAPASRQGGIFKQEDGQWTFTDGQGNVYYFADTTGSNVDIIFPAASEQAPDKIRVVKRLTGGANTLTVTALSGNIDGSATHSIPTQYASYSYIAYNGDYWII
jgi:hypothetical protein